MRLFFPIIAFLLPLTLYPQIPGNFNIKGTVSDATTHEPIENAHIVIRGTLIGTASNDRGDFTISVNKLPVILEITHIIYDPKTIELTFPPASRLDIHLNPATRELSGITVKSQRLDTLFKSNLYSVLDYELLDQGILLLIYKAKLTRAELLFTDFDGKPLDSLRILPLKPLTLLKDCLENVHIITKNDTYQVFINKDGIQLYPAVPVEEFTAIMEGCRFRLGSRLYFEKFTYFDLAKVVYYIDSASHQAQVLTVIRDQEKMDFLHYNPENFRLLAGSSTANLGDLRGTAADSSILAMIRNEDVELRFNRMAYLSPVFAPVFRMKDTVCVFNHPERTIEFYDLHDNLFRKTEIRYNPDQQIQPLGKSPGNVPKPQPEMLFDEEKGKAYTSHQKANGTTAIYEIDLHTGELIYSLTVPFPYVQKMAVKNNLLFFIYKGWGETTKKKLFRQQLPVGSDTFTP